MNRKKFILRSAAAGAAWFLNPMTVSAQNKPDPYPAEIVKNFVGAGHNNLDNVKKLLEEFPNLLYSRYDWGNGDFEEAIEGAGHVGNKEIALYLIAKGARPNLFVLSMLGETNLVKPIIEKYPSLLHAKGAHGFTLLHHASRGGEDARELLEYFTAKGLKEMRINIK